MNKQRLIVGILLLVGVVGCGEEEEFVDPRKRPVTGTANVLLNDESWVMQPGGGSSGCKADRLSMNFGYFNEQDFLRMLIVIGNFPASTGKYVLRRLDIGQNECATDIAYGSFTTALDDGDVGGPSYQIVEEAGDNELVITQYDSAARTITGHFQMTLAGPGPFSIDDLYFPDTLRITYGTFEQKLSPPRE